MDTLQKIRVLQETYPNEEEFDQILGKLLDAALGQHQLRRERYERDLREFEQRYGLTSAEFYRRFENGEMGDLADYFEWASLYELYEDLQAKIRRLETAR